MDSSPPPANRLDSRVTSAWRIQALVAGLPALAASGVLTFVLLSLEISPLLAWAAPVAVVAWLALWLTLVPAYRYRRWRWEVSTEEIRLQRGLIVIERTVIPMVRIQHVDTSQGPIIGAFGLSEVRVSTAAGTHAIPALADADAGELRDRIAQLARVSDDGGL